MFQNDTQALAGGQVVGNVLFAYGHNVPDNRALVVAQYDNEVVDVQLLRQEAGADGLINLADYFVAQCKVTGRKVEALTIAVANGLTVGGADSWSCFSSDNEMRGVAEIFFPCDNEGIQEWLRQVYRELPDEGQGASVVETVAVLQGMSAILWAELGLEDCADVAGMVDITKELYT